MKLLQYNGFGLVTIKRDKLTASVTIVADQRSITRTVVEELSEPLNSVDSKETTALVFGAWIENGKQSRVTAHEMTALKSGKLAFEIPQVQEIVKRVLEMAKHGAKVT